MGHASSHEIYSANDFELVIRSSKELEHLLEEKYSAAGKGLIEKSKSAKLPNGQGLPKNVLERIYTLVRERNKLIHDVNYNEIEHRHDFIHEYEAALKDILAVLEPVPPHKGHKRRCVIQ